MRTRSFLTKAITIKLTETQLARLDRQAGPDQSTTEYARTLLLAAAGEPAPHLTAQMEELWALRYILINALPAVPLPADREALTALIRHLIQEADQKKVHKAQVILEGRDERVGPQ